MERASLAKVPGTRGMMVYLKRVWCDIRLEWMKQDEAACLDRKPTAHYHSKAGIEDFIQILK